MKRALRIALWAGAAILLAPLLFALTAWIGSSIPRNGGWVEPETGIEIMVETNGVHTSIVLPLLTPEKDWRVSFPASHIAAPDRPYTHVSVSWGEREVFLNTPTWGDLSPMTVLRVIGFGGDSLLHVYHYASPAPADHLRPLRLTREQYRRLVERIEAHAPGPLTQRFAGYGARDVFYDTPGHYTANNTCNQWTSDTLASAGVKAGWWTPLAGGVMKWFPARESSPPRG